MRSGYFLPNCSVRIARAIILIVWFLASIAMVSGCGVKASPKVPSREPLPSIRDLKSQTTGDRLVLTWSLPDKAHKSAGSDAVLGFTIYRSKFSMTDTRCPSCPVVFERIADVPARGAEGPFFRYTETLEKGYRYAYKVRAYGSARAEASEAGLVSFDY